MRRYSPTCRDAAHRLTVFDPWRRLQIFFAETKVPTVQGNRSLAGAYSCCRWTLWTASSSQMFLRRPAPRPRPRHRPPPASQPSRQIRPPWPRCAVNFPCRGSVALKACMKPLCSCPLFAVLQSSKKQRMNVGLVASIINMLEAQPCRPSVSMYKITPGLQTAGLHDHWSLPAFK